MTASRNTTWRSGSAQATATALAENAGSPVAVSHRAAPSTSRANEVTDVTSRVRAPWDAVRVPRSATRATTGTVASSRVTSQVPMSREAATATPPVAAASSRVVVTVVSRGPRAPSWSSASAAAVASRMPACSVPVAGPAVHRQAPSGPGRHSVRTGSSAARRPVASAVPAAMASTTTPSSGCHERRPGRTASPSSTSTAPRAGSRAGARLTASMVTSSLVTGHPRR